jgi:hypothetical protein
MTGTAPAADTDDSQADPPGADQHDDDQGQCYWELGLGIDGRLTAVLVGIDPPIVVTAADEMSLRKEIRARTLL